MGPFQKAPSGDGENIELTQSKLEFCASVLTSQLTLISGTDAMASNGSGGGPGVGLGGPPEGVLFRSEPMSR